MNEGEVIWESQVDDDISVRVTRYGEKGDYRHRTDIVSDNMVEDLSDMTPFRTLQLARTLRIAAMSYST